MSQAQVDPNADASSPKDYAIPGTLIGVGMLIHIGYGFMRRGVAGAEAMMLYESVSTTIQVILGIIACFLTAKIMGASFGYITPAIVKLAAVFVFPGAITFFIPWVGGVIALLLYWGLLEWLFELDAMETIVLAIVIWVVNAGAIFLVAAIGFAAMK